MCIYIHQKGKHIAYHILPCKIYTSKFHQRKNHLMSNCITVWYLIISRHNMIWTSTLSKIEWYHFIKGSLKELPCYGYLWWPRMNGMEWNGMDWLGLDWIGMEWKWNGLEKKWNGVEWNGMTWHDATKASSFRFWRMSRTKASFSHLPLSDFEGRLARKLHFHMCHFQILRDVSHESFIFTCAIFRFWGTSRTKASFSLRCWGTSRTKASFSHLPFSDFEGCLARKLRFHICHFQILRDVSHESFIFTSATFRFWGTSRTKASFSHVRFWRTSRTKASFSHLPLSDFEGCLARKLRFHMCHFQILRDVSHESLVFTSATFRFWGRLARKLRFHICHFQILRDVSHESFIFTCAIFNLFEGSLARKLHFHICHFQTLRDVWHEIRF